MKRYSIILLLMLSFPESNAQYWANHHSVWHIGIIESYFSPAQGFIKTEVTGDTLLLNQNCKILHNTRHYADGRISNIGNEYMYEDSGKVYHFMNNSFYTLYDFNAMPGDTWTLSVPFPSPFCGISLYSCDTLVKIVVDSVSTITIQNQPFKTLYVHSVNSDWYFMNPLIQNIGSRGGLFPFIYGFMDIDIPYLRCYQDSLVSYHSGTSLVADCDSLISRVAHPENQDQVKVFPNPVTEILYVETTLTESNMFVFDISSRIVLEAQLQRNSSLNLSSLSKGIYYYEIKKGNNLVTKGKLIRL